MMAIDKSAVLPNNSAKNSQSTNRVFRLLTELGLLGLFMRLLQVIVIISILQYGSIFKNPSQLNVLIPVFICTLIVLASVTFAEIQCEQYMARLDQRFGIIISALGFNKQVNKSKNYLQKVFLPVLIGVPALPFLIIFLSLTTPYLFSIVVISMLISAAVVRHYNRSEHKVRESEISSAVNKMMNQDIIDIPAYLLTKSKGNKDIESANINMDESLILDDFQYQDISGASKKRQYLSLIRKSTRAFVLAAAVLLSILQITSIAKIAGFLIISGAFRSACLALFEFTTSSNKMFPFSDGFLRIKLALLSPGEIITHLEKQYNLEQSNLELFNNTHQQGILSHPYLRLKQVTLKDEFSNVLIENITGRVQLSALTIIKVGGSSLVTSMRKLFKEMRLDKLLKNYYLDGEFVLSSNKLGADFLEMLPQHNPWEITITSTSLVDSFSQKYANEINELIKKYKLNQYIDSGKDNISISSISNKQANKMRAIICLLFHIVEPSAISVAPFTLDIFDENERSLLIEFLSIELKKKSVVLILFTRHKPHQDYADKYYEISREQLLKI